MHIFLAALKPGVLLPLILIFLATVIYLSFKYFKKQVHHKVQTVPPPFYEEREPDLPWQKKHYVIESCSNRDPLTIEPVYIGFFENGNQIPNHGLSVVINNETTPRNLPLYLMSSDYVDYGNGKCVAKIKVVAVPPAELNRDHHLVLQLQTGIPIPDPTTGGTQNIPRPSFPERLSYYQDIAAAGNSAADHLSISVLP